MLQLEVLHPKPSGMNRGRPRTPGLSVLLCSIDLQPMVISFMPVIQVPLGTLSLCPKGTHEHRQSGDNNLPAFLPTPKLGTPFRDAVSWAPNMGDAGGHNLRHEWAGYPSALAKEHGYGCPNSNASACPKPPARAASGLRAFVFTGLYQRSLGQRRQSWSKA